MDRIKTFLKRKVYGIPTFMILFFVFAVPAMALWLRLILSQGNILGLQGTSLEYSTDNATWVGDVPQMFDDPLMSVGATTPFSGYWKASGTPATLTMRLANVVYTEGPGQGAVSGESLLSYYRMTSANWSGTVDIGASVTDANGNGYSDLEDIQLSPPAFPYQDQTQMNLNFVLEDPTGVDELNGDSVSFDVEWEAND